jgi:acetyltransferase-like isoleucine patch superfamily enzyme
LTRLRHPRTRVGRGTDVRRRFCLRQEAGAAVSFGNGCVLDNDLTVEVGGVLRVGDRVIFGHHCTVAAVERIEIGDDCMFAELVSIRDHDHAFGRADVPYREQGHVSAPVRIGRNVWLGAKVTVVKGVTIGDNAVVGANAVVTRDVPPNSVAAGVPARVIRRLP